MTTTTNDSAIAAVAGGFGLTRLLSYQVAEDVAAGRLRIILDEHEEAPWPVHLVHRESKFGSSKVRRFIDMLAEHLRGHQYLQ